MNRKVLKYLTEYVVNSETMAIVPVLTKENVLISKVIETNDEFYVLQKPLDIIEKSCRFYGASFYGRKAGTKELIRVSHKQSIAISPTDYLYFFPTSSYTRKDCIWVSHSHVDQTDALPHNNLLLHFITGRSIKIDVSKGSFDNQLYRTAQLRVEFENRKERKLFPSFQFFEPQEIFEIYPEYGDEPLPEWKE
ncbi:competence protein ComK [Microbacteriaceae bacterium 4G12]